MNYIGAKQDFRTTRLANKENAYNTFTRGKGGPTAADRMDADFPDIKHTPKFKLDRSDVFFTIGSCFARNVEGALANLGVKNITAASSFRGDLYAQAGTGRNSALNAFTPHSMLSLIQLPSRPDRMTAGSLALGGDLVADMMTSGLRSLTKDDFQEVRSEIVKTYSRMNEADVFIITLGFTESWWDNVDDIYTNKSPGTSAETLKKGDRYSFHNISPQQAVDTVRSIVAEVRRATNDRARVILTASPVPLHRTWTKRDVVVANTYSKATLVTAANVVADEFDYVDYFPSYEMVIYGNPSETWMPDGVHVKSAKVQRVMERFADLYFS